ncbi:MULTISPECIES: winged helix-turn-helix domain-containing protein [Vibrio harveyi group]|uniref:winged helix-turn-helix domain-containing protein n=1 Tax=Vibrio harveyi group TaxID=717610 RepID=UPI001F0876BE|nr:MULTISPECIES: winged helix-turn-helix domain-containing protein [Vibrio harveyi group]MEA5376661.1 winged helix-turn-helix domain-containing protein [Vibrio parahaemolyticus]UMM06739.1 winged helix-turn-helix domain-containing protein [Vibrio campbellii]
MTSRTITCDVRCLNADDVQRAKVLNEGEPFARVPYRCRVSGKSQDLMLLTDAAAENLAMALTPLSDPVTLKILHALGSSELCECDLATLTECNDADILERLEKLVRFGFLTRRQLHDMTYYSLAEKGMESEDFLIRVLRDLSPATQEKPS